MSGQEDLKSAIDAAVEDYRLWGFPEPYALSPNLDLAVRAKARIEALEAEVADLKKWWGRSVRATEKREQERDALKAELERRPDVATVDALQLERDAAEQKSAELAAVIEEVRAWNRNSLGSVCYTTLEDRLSAVPADVLSACTTRIREEAVVGEWEYGVYTKWPTEVTQLIGHGEVALDYAKRLTSGTTPSYDKVMRRRAAGPWSEIPEGQNCDD